MSANALAGMQSSRNTILWDLASYNRQFCSVKGGIHMSAYIGEPNHSSRGQMEVGVLSYTRDVSCYINAEAKYHNHEVSVFTTVAPNMQALHCYCLALWKLQLLWCCHASIRKLCAASYLGLVPCFFWMCILIQLLEQLLWYAPKRYGHGSAKERCIQNKCIRVCWIWY
jgi:hypothetical protein